MRRALGALAATLLGLVLVAPAAGAVSAKNAKAAAEGSVAAYLPSGPGQTGICDVKTQSGFFAKKHSYLSSCATTDGSFQYFFIANASKGGLNIKSPYLTAQLNTFCNGTGYAYAAGVRGKFLAVFAENGTGGGTIAKGLRDQLADQLSKYAGQRSTTLCELGQHITK
jgi:hypothetical protein